MNLIDESEDKSLPFVATIIAAVVIGLVGIYLRFADFRYSSQIADVILGIATIIVFTSVFKWMKK
jgi:ABC-type nitrate/sulfonate/bicarbonate transport system permease component